MAQLLRYLITGLLLCLYAGFRLSAQPAPGQPDDLDIHFNVFAPRAYQGLCYLPDNDPQKAISLKFYNSYRSPSYHYTGSQPLKIYETNEIKTAIDAVSGTTDPVVLPEPVAVVAIPVGLAEGFLLFVPQVQTDKTKRRFNVFVLNDSETNVPANHVVIINASRQEWPARVNGKDMVITRGVMTPVAVKGDRVTILLTNSNPQFQSVLLSDDWPSNKRLRSLVILFPPRTANDLLPEMIRLIDHVSEKEGEKTAASRS